MANKIINSRSVQKHDTAANWAKATTFVPLAGEIIVYTDGTGGGSTPLVKIGDGTTTVGVLPFTSADFVSKSGIVLRSTTVTNVLTQDTSDNSIQKRSADNLLEDIGGISYGINDSTGVLSLKFGKQSS